MNSSGIPGVRRRVLSGVVVLAATAVMSTTVAAGAPVWSASPAHGAGNTPNTAASTIASVDSLVRPSLPQAHKDEYGRYGVGAGARTEGVLVVIDRYRYMAAGDVVVVSWGSDTRAAQHVVTQDEVDGSGYLHLRVPAWHFVDGVGDGVDVPVSYDVRRVGSGTVERSVVLPVRVKTTVPGGRSGVRRPGPGCPAPSPGTGWTRTRPTPACP